MIIELTPKDTLVSHTISEVNGNSLRIHRIDPAINYDSKPKDNILETVVSTPLTLIFHRQESVDRLIAALNKIKPE